MSPICVPNHMAAPCSCSGSEPRSRPQSRRPQSRQHVPSLSKDYHTREVSGSDSGRLGDGRGPRNVVRLPQCRPLEPEHPAACPECGAPAAAGVPRMTQIQGTNPRSRSESEGGAAVALLDTTVGAVNPEENESWPPARRWTPERPRTAERGSSGPRKNGEKGVS